MPTRDQLDALVLEKGYLTAYELGNMTAAALTTFLGARGLAFSIEAPLTQELIERIDAHVRSRRINPSHINPDGTIGPQIYNREYLERLSRPPDCRCKSFLRSFKEDGSVSARQHFIDYHNFRYGRCGPYCLRTGAEVQPLPSFNHIPANITYQEWLMFQRGKSGFTG